MNYIAGAIFLIVSIICYLLQKKKEHLTGWKSIKVCFIYLYFGIMMGAFCCFATINHTVSILIFSHLFLIGMISAAKEKKHSLLVYDLIVVCILIFILAIYDLFQLDLGKSYILGILIALLFLLPGLGYIERRKDIANKIKNCTQEVEATILKVHKSSVSSVVPIYIPKLEFTFNNKKYKIMESSEIFSRSLLSVGDKLKLFINPNNPNDVFLPDPRKEQFVHFAVYSWYIITIAIGIFVLYLRIFH